MHRIIRRVKLFWGIGTYLPVLVALALLITGLLSCWEIFKDSNTNTFWQMFLGVALGAVATTIVIFIVTRIQSNIEAEERDKAQESQHRQAIAREKKVVLYDDLLKYVVERAYDDENEDDIKKIEEFIYSLRIYSNHAVIEAAKIAFESVSLSNCGQEKEKIYQLCKACNDDLYSTDYISSQDTDDESICKFMRTIQKRIIGISEDVERFTDITFNYKGKSAEKIDDILWYELSAYGSVKEYNSNIKIEGAKLKENQAALVRFCIERYAGRNGNGYFIIGLAVITDDGKIKWRGVVNLDNAIPYHKVDIKEAIGFDQLLGEYSRLSSQLKEIRDRNIRTFFNSNICGKIELGKSYITGSSCSNYVCLETRKASQFFEILSYVYMNDLQINSYVDFTDYPNVGNIPLFLTGEFIKVKIDNKVKSINCLHFLFFNDANGRECIPGNEEFFVKLRGQLKELGFAGNKIYFETFLELHMNEYKNKDELNSISLYLKPITQTEPDIAGM